MTCCGVGRREVWGEGECRRRGRWRGGVRGRWWLGEGEMGGVRKSCKVALSKLTPHSPDQSRQVGRRDGPTPRREEETHCWTNTDSQTDRQTDGRRRWGMEGWGGRLRTVLVSRCVRRIHDLPWRRREEQPEASRRRREKRESLVKWHYGNDQTQSLRHAASPSVSVFTCTQHSN